MAFNPSKQGEPLSSPSNGRKNTTNDPGYENQQGYYPYSLGHTEVCPTLFGHITPSFHLVTAMGDHHVMVENNKLLLNRINGNFLNKVNQYTDTLFVSNRTMFPKNWDKLIPNPIKGDDLPNSARPVVPLFAYFNQFWRGTTPIAFATSAGEVVTTNNADALIVTKGSYSAFIEDSNYFNYSENWTRVSYTLANFTFLASILSRGQLLDYLGIQFDFPRTDTYLTSFQYRIDQFFDKLYQFYVDNGVSLFNLELSADSDEYDLTAFYNLTANTVDSPIRFRERYMTAHERGQILFPYLDSVIINNELYFVELIDAIDSLHQGLITLFGNFGPRPISYVDTWDEFNSTGECINLSKVLAYQLSVAQYFTNDTVDNIFTSDLFMQLLRGTMYPSVNGMSTELTFDYNGVPTEYDYLSYGGFYHSLLTTTIPGSNSRLFIVGSLLFLLRRSLRYGDYFTTGRTRLLAVSDQLYIPSSDDNGNMIVNPVDVAVNLVSLRYLNAANRIGNKPLAYYASVMGVTPSDMPSIPRYVAHRQIELENRITTNTANAQGEQTTNLVGYSDGSGFDVFIDDYGILMSVLSYDVLPIYNSGIDSDNFLSDRFEYFNPMMQNIGDQPIRLSELIGYPRFYGTTFAYTVRNSEYKFKLSKAHGVLSYEKNGYLLKFPFYQFNEGLGTDEVIQNIDPDFIRDKPSLLDSIIYDPTATSPGQYFHFIVSVDNQLKSARLIQKAPGILF